MQFFWMVINIVIVKLTRIGVLTSTSCTNCRIMRSSTVTVGRYLYLP
jgi:hypothetical protein